MECDLDSFRSTFGTVHFISYMQTANSLFPSSGSTVWHPGCKNTTRTEERHRERVGIWASLTPLSMTLSWLKASLCSCLMTMFNWKRWRFRMCNERFCAGYYCSRAELLNLNLLWFKSFAYWGSIACMCVPLHVCVCVKILVHVHIYMLTCSPWWMCELWVRLERHSPCVMSCEPPSPFLHSYCLRPSYSSKKQKGRYCIRYWLWDGIILCSTIHCA